MAQVTNKQRTLRLVGSFPAGITIDSIAAGLGVTRRTAAGAARALVVDELLDQDETGRLTITTAGQAQAW